MEAFDGAIIWVLVAFVTSPAWATLLWVIWNEQFRPQKIPAVEIERLVDQLIADHGSNADVAAFIEEDRAWRYSDNFERGRWRLIRRAIARRSPTAVESRKRAGTR